MDLREQIAAIIYDAVGEVSNEPNLVDTGAAADAILAIPEIRDALEKAAQLELEADALWHEMKYPRD
jgi:hypothetical protein